MFQIRCFFVILVIVFFYCTPANADTIKFSGMIDVIEFDAGAGVYSDTPLNATFSGFLDDDTFSGQISDGKKLTSCSCCIAAGGLSIANDFSLDADTAKSLNEVTGTQIFAAEDVFDLVNIECDAATTSGGRIEFGLSFLFDAKTFDNENPDNYPFDSNDVLLKLFFIYEENQNGDDVYSALGELDAVHFPWKEPSHPAVLSISPTDETAGVSVNSQIGRASCRERVCVGV